MQIRSWFLSSWERRCVAHVCSEGAEAILLDYVKDSSALGSLQRKRTILDLFIEWIVNLNDVQYILSYS